MSTKRSIKKQYRIGRKDKIDLPELDLFNIKAKVDTGAFTSAIHCSSFEEGEDEQGPYLEFVLFHKKHDLYNGDKHKVRDFTQRVIKSSFGNKEIRYIIRTKVIMFGQEFGIEFSLSDRKKMKFPILIGRKFLMKGNFVVEVNQYDLSFKQKQKLS